MQTTRIGVIQPVYNNADFVDLSLESIKDFADEIIIVEGAWNPALPSRSTDGTIEKIEAFRERNKEKADILYYEATNKTKTQSNTYQPIVLGNELAAKQMGLLALELKCKDNKLDWWMLVDSDEIYKPQDLIKLKSYLNTLAMTDELFRIKINAFVFYFNMFFGTEEYYQRINRVKGELLIDYTDTLRYLENHQEIVILEVPPKICQFYHYGYHKDDRVQVKMSMWQEQDTKDWYENVWLKNKDNPNIEEGNYHLFAKRLGYGGKFKKFKGEHPESVKERFRI